MGLFLLLLLIYCRVVVRLSVLGSVLLKRNGRGFFFVPEARSNCVFLGRVAAELRKAKGPAVANAFLDKIRPRNSN